MARIPNFAAIIEHLRSLRPAAGHWEFSLPDFLSRSVGIAGFAAVLCSAFTSWFSVPTVVSLNGQLLAEEPPASWAYRTASLCVCVATLLVFFRKSPWKPRMVRIYLFWVVCLLLFPYFLTVWSADAAGRASWLQNQHESLTTGTGDSYISQQNMGSLLRHRVNVVNLPIETQVVELPDWKPEGFSWSRMLGMAEWFGLSDWFASFFRIGWPLALFGSVAILLALSREEGPERGRTAQRLLLQGSGIFLAAIIVALGPVVVGRNCLLAAKRCAQMGEYASARRLMRWAARCLPVITQDGDYLVQVGLLADALGLPDSEAICYRARLAEDAGFYFQARTMYLEGLSSDRNQPALIREDAKGVLRHAANAMNAGEVDSATVLLEQVLAADPTNLKANYSLQLAYLRSGNVVGLRALRQRMTNVYAFFNTPLKDPVLANAAENQAIGELLGGDPPAALKAWVESRRH